MIPHKTHTHTQVNPWLSKSTTALQDVGVFPDASIIGKWPVADTLACLDAFKPITELLSAMSQISQTMTLIKGGSESDMSQLHELIHNELRARINKFQDSLNY